MLGGGGDCSCCSNGERLLGRLAGRRCRAVAATALGEFGRWYCGEEGVLVLLVGSPWWRRHGGVAVRG